MLKPARIMLLLGAALCATLLTTPATAAPLPTQSVARLSSTTQCGPLATRRGPWTCASPPTGPRVTAAVSPFCLALYGTPGCWELTPNSFNVRASFYTNNVRYGVDATTLGKVTLDVNWYMSGPTISTVVNRITNSSASLLIRNEVYVFNGTTNVVGSVKGACPPVTTSINRAGQGIAPLQTVGFPRCNIYDNASWDHHSLDVFKWVLQDRYRNIEFFSKVRSPVAHSDDKQVFLFDSAADLPGYPWQAGWSDTLPVIL